MENISRKKKRKKTKIRLFGRFPSIKILSDRIFNNFRGEHLSLTLKIICYKIDVAFFYENYNIWPLSN